MVINAIAAIAVKSVVDQERKVRMLVIDAENKFFEL